MDKSQFQGNDIFTYILYYLLRIFAYNYFAIK